jgi:hypothetical protein
MFSSSECKWLIIRPGAVSMNMTIKLQVSQNVRNIFTSWATISFSRRALLPPFWFSSDNQAI